MTEPMKNAADGILPELFAGKDLRVFLKPDDQVENRKGTQTYIESLDLPHIIIKDDFFWACQRNLVLSPSSGAMVSHFYSYYSGLDLFSSSFYSSIREAASRTPQKSYLMSTGRYEELKWITHGSFELVYDSRDEAGTIGQYTQAIREGGRFKALVETTDGLVQMHPLIYPFYFPDEEAIDFQTEIQFFPDFMRMGRDDVDRKLLRGRAQHFADSRNKDAKETTVLYETSFFSSYFRIFNGAKGYRIYDVLSEKQHQFARVMVFATP